MAVKGPGDAGTAAPAAPAENTDLSNLSDDDLQRMLKDPNLSKEDKQAVLDEIAKRNRAKGEGGGETEELMQKLKNGTISEEELSHLAELLGVSVEDLKDLKGSGGAGGDGDDGKGIE